MASRTGIAIASVAVASAVLAVPAPAVGSPGTSKPSPLLSTPRPVTPPPTSPLLGAPSPSASTALPLTSGELVSLTPPPDRLLPSQVSLVATPMATGVSPQFSSGNIDCLVKANYPHKSTHDPSQTNATSTITCSAPVAKLEVTTQLYFNGNAKGTLGSASNTGKNFVQSQANFTCGNGTWKNYTTGLVHFPPGFDPSVEGGETESLATVVC